jgi:hypothetical protein
MMPRVLVWISLAAAAWAQPWDLPGRAAESLSKAADKKLKLAIEERGRFENRTGNVFGADRDTGVYLTRFRAGLSWTPAEWVKLSGMMQDCRAPFYGPNAPNNLRDGADLQEGYLELFPSRKKGFGMTIGRMMKNYGEGRLIGSPQWSNLTRTWDHMRLYWRSPNANLEVLFVSPIKIRIGEFNRPVLGDRIWGTYNTFPHFFKNQLELYFLRHEQNRPGGFAGVGSLGVNTIGFRLLGPLAGGIQHSIEAAYQTGHVGPAKMRAAAWFASLSRRWTAAGKPLDVSVEYKYASGTANPADPKRTGTFDQMYPANHDKMGHADIFGYRNNHSPRTVASLGVTANLKLNVMYCSLWLAQVRDALYNIGSRPISRSPDGSAGRHIGQEADIYGTYRYKHFTFGAGYGHFFPGEFVRNTTRGISPAYAYFFHSYSL